MHTLARIALAQGIAFLLSVSLTPIMPLLPAAKLILQGSLAAMAGRLLKLPYWWVPINLLLPLVGALLLGVRL